jgi:hypothetical protein
MRARGYAGVCMGTLAYILVLLACLRLTQVFSVGCLFCILCIVRCVAQFKVCRGVSYFDLRVLLMSTL